MSAETVTLSHDVRKREDTTVVPTQSKFQFLGGGGGVLVEILEFGNELGEQVGLPFF